MGRRSSFIDRTTGFFGIATGVVGILATLALLFNMFAIWWYADQFFGENGPTDLKSAVILGGFLAILLFNILAVVWVILDGFYYRKYTAFEFMLIMFGVACIILLYGQKSMIDELGRERPTGWDRTGEWVILYILLCIQLVYNTLILLRRFVPERIGYGKNY
ncbi:MAG: hypothetical protein IIA50_01365 [Bacteroidetes bacterium]|nr:hypothetical protein [Bacteroidota bacterium]